MEALLERVESRELEEGDYKIITDFHSDY